VDGCHTSHALLLRQLLSEAMALQMVSQNNKSVPIYEDFYPGTLQWMKLICCSLPYLSLLLATSGIRTAFKRAVSPLAWVDAYMVAVHLLILCVCCCQHHPP